jgi:hypothetical protein
MKRLGIAAVLMTAVAGAASAQGTCPASTVAPSAQNGSRDICLRATDLYQLMAPQLGVSITGGNPVLGQGGTLGGIGHFTVEARAIAVMGDIPDLPNWSAPSITVPASQQLASKDFPVGLPAVDGAVGLFKGLPLGLTNVGGIDALVSAVYIPNVDQNGFKVTPETNLKFGYGARVGVLQESLLIPGLSVTWMKRDLPTTTLEGATTGATNMSFKLSNFSEKTTAWRIVASKSLILFGLAAGYGQDKYESAVTFSGTSTSTVGSSTFGPFDFGNSMTRSTMFANASINLLLLKIVGEVGQVSGGDLAVPPFNTFSSGKADDTRLYGSVGVRFSW